jgi:hypothetical protein
MRRHEHHRQTAHRGRPQARGHGLRVPRARLTGPAIPATFEADAMHALLVLRADALEGCPKNSEEACELAMIVEAVDAYEAKRWPDGK